MPLPLQGGLISWRWFRTYDHPPQRQSGDKLVQSWDTASKATEKKMASIMHNTCWD
jgi:hypothetical protein